MKKLFIGLIITSLSSFTAYAGPIIYIENHVSDVVSSSMKYFSLRFHYDILYTTPPNTQNRASSSYKIDLAPHYNIDWSDHNNFVLKNGQFHGSAADEAISKYVFFESYTDGTCYRVENQIPPQAQQITIVVTATPLREGEYDLHCEVKAN